MSSFVHFTNYDGRMYKLETTGTYTDYWYNVIDDINERINMDKDMVFKVHKTDIGIVLTNSGVIEPVVYIKGVLTHENKSFMDIIGRDLVEDKDEKIVYTVLNIDDENNLSTTYTDITTNTLWQDDGISTDIKTKKYIKNYFRYSLPVKYKDSIISLINKTAGVLFKDISKNIITDINAPAMEIVLNNAQVKEAITELKIYKKDLDEYLKKVKEESKTNIESFINRYAFKEHILLLGPAGFSKTYTASKYLIDNKIDTEHLIGHEAIESIDMLGYYVKNETGNLVWMDGPLTSAFRKAKDHKVALFIDEILRIPSKELNILVGSLTPNSEGNFVLRTNRIVDTKDGLGVSETLIVPKENLWVIATTNIGADYDVEEIDKALNDRFMQLDVEPDDETVRDIIMSVGSGKFGEEHLNKLYEVYLLVKKMADNKELPHYLNVRNLVRVINNAEKVTEFKKYLKDITPQVVSRNADGKLNRVEVEIYHDIIESKV